MIRISLNDELRIYADEQVIATHTLCDRRQGWVTVPEHHAELWKSTLNVEQRSLDVYEEMATWN